MRIVLITLLVGCSAPQIVHPGPDPVTLARLQQCDERDERYRSFETLSGKSRELAASSAQLRSDLDRMLDPVWAAQYEVEKLAARAEELRALEQAATELADGSRGENAEVLRALSIRITEIRRDLEQHRQDAVARLLSAEELIFARRGVPERLATQLVAFEQGCEEAHAPSCYRAGMCYAKGVGIRPDPVYAGRAFETACEQGHARSCFELGSLQLEGAVYSGPNGPWPAYLKACDGGVAASCEFLGDRSLRGDGVQLDAQAAGGFYRRACVAGQVSACVKGGLLYRDGSEGLPQNGETAVFLLELACDGGAPLGCETLGEIFLKGIGVPVDTERGREIRERACALGSFDACVSK
ncbi:MAG: hypothetical protein AAFU77_05955 [Myxococcota bacterium]